MTLEHVFGLKGRVAVVVGASSGLGAECARALCGAGADVALLARRRDRLDELAIELRGQGARIHVIAVDVLDDAAMQRAIDEVESALGPIWALINSAGMTRLGRAIKHSRERWDQVIAVNLTAAFVMSQIVARKFIERGAAGRIVHISSVLGRGGSALHPQAGYAASKGGVDNLTRQLAVEWAGNGITVNAIAPGYFPTEITVDAASNEMDPAFLEGVRRLTPLGRPGELREIHSAVLFLVAPGSSYVTGTIVPVDGGWTAW